MKRNGIDSSSVINESATNIKKDISQKYDKYFEKTEKLAEGLSESVTTLEDTTNTLKNAKDDFVSIGDSLKNEISEITNKTSKILRRSFAINLFAMFLMLILLYFIYDMSSKITVFKNDISVASEQNSLLIDTLAASLLLQQQLVVEVNSLSQIVSQQNIQDIHERLANLSSKVDSLQLLTIERVEILKDSILFAIDLNSEISALSVLVDSNISLNNILITDCANIQDSVDVLTDKVVFQDSAIVAEIDTLKNNFDESASELSNLNAIVSELPNLDEIVRELQNQIERVSTNTSI